MSVDSDFSALQSAIDEQEADTDLLRDNKVRDLVEIANGNVIANEQQVVFGHLSLCTGYMWSHDRNVNHVYTGPSAGGKSDTQDAVTSSLPMDEGYNVTDTSSKGVLDDDSWEKTLFAPLDEWQKIPDEVTELVKSLSGGADDEYRYVRSVSDEDAESGRKGHEIVKKAKPYGFLYAQHAMDHELSTRLLFLPVDDNVHIRDAIVEKQGGATDISVEGYDKEFIFDTYELEQAMREHLRGIPTEVDEDDHKRGSVDAVLPPWIRKSVKPIFDMNRVETNRVSGQVFNLIRASAVVNYDNRRETTVTHDGKEVTAYIAEPQDAANILSGRETLLAKTHHLTKIKREVLDAIRAHQHFDSGEEGVGVTVSTIRDYLEDKSALSVPRKEKLRDLLRELDEQFYIDIHERAGANGAHLYEFKSLRDIGVPRVGNLAQHMDADELERCDELCPDLELDDPYADATDPFRDQPFVETVDEMRDEFAQNPVERAARSADLAAEANGEGADSSSSKGGGQTDVTALSDAMNGDGDVSVTLDGPVERAVHKRLQEHADDEPWKVDEVEDAHLIGVVEQGESVPAADLNGTLFDPDHEVWDQPTKPDEWVVSQGDAESEVEEAITALERKGAVEFDTTDVPEGYVAVHVTEVDG
ncbi:hypothetical protein PN419_00175 [Halorubrum ezzemoulense]|uniref:hypothetical protein n=1 Tax=Halorubrum ezzemoulense TaxID=337243 RepID=UPI0023307847|nr:hypothetical protein [Halorubrum ezzemoulense]MDB9247422.1 hypothetical protein [Halorubrum ezzemoulense]MDB9258669.1 hypothetical protein [Halorubrum ezzemoulense]MDB9264473.1 hypothetical protein [Halorubrum ezzemoulense]MDB9269030.1 hypothetical protein [Halorubrum ezzemoulense]MDB9271441.1 hypothetical protein [Halorubrum ezzemoulense]